MSKRYLFIINTDQYAGNFERELCAFCTGVIGACGVGETEQNKFIKDYNEDKVDEMCELLEQRCENEGCERPVSVSFPNTSLEIYFYNKPTQEVIDMIKERANRFELKDWNGKSKPLSILGFKLKIETTIVECIDI